MRGCRSKPNSSVSLQLYYKQCSIYCSELYTFINQLIQNNKITQHMQHKTEARMVQILRSAHTWAQQKQRKLLNDIFNMEKIINRAYDTKPQTRKIQTVYVKKQQPKEEDKIIEFNNKIDQMISKAKEQIQILSNPQPNNKNKPNFHNANNYKNIQPLPPLQKKPPVPVVNRAKQPQTVTHKPNYHYRNKNQITGKITQTPIMKPANHKNSVNSNSAQKIATKPNNNTIFTQPTQKNKNISEKVIIVKRQQVHSSQAVKQGTSTQTRGSVEHKKQSNSLGPKQPKKQQSKNIYVNFANFMIPIQNLIQQQSQARNKKISLRKQSIQKLISQYDKQELGHRQNQKKASKNLLSMFNKLAATKSKLPVPVDSKLKIARRNWQGNLQPFKLQRVLDHFQALLQKLPSSQQQLQEYAIDPKQLYKIKCWHEVIEQISRSQQQIRQNLKLPPKLGINFQMNNKAGADTLIQDYQLQSQNGQLDRGNPYMGNFYQILGEELQQLINQQSLNKELLRKLRFLICVGVHDGRRTPVFVQLDKFQEWRQHYQN